MTHPPRKLKGGGYAVLTVLSPEVMGYARRQWRPLGYVCVEDYLNALLNTAVLEEMERSGALPELTPEDWRRL